MSEHPPSEPQRLGKTMIYVAWLIVLGMLTLFFSGILEHQRNPNQQIAGQGQDNIREVVLQRNRQGHYIANGFINDTPVTFFLDTGATMVSIPEHIANRIQLHKGMKVELTTANGIISAYSTLLDHIRLGTIQLHKIRAVINPNTDEDEILLGMSFLRHLEFTQKGNTLILRQSIQD